MENRANANTKDNPLNSPETFEHQWPQLKGQVKSWWDRLTDADLEQVGGKKTQLIQLVQQKYGYARERAEQEVERRLGEYRDMNAGIASSLAATAGEVGTKVQDMATAAATSVTSTVSGAGTYLQDMPGDFVGLIRRYPIPSLLVGIGVGFLLARSFGSMLMTSQGGEDQRETGYPNATIQCLRCGQMVRQSDMVGHSAICPGTGSPVGQGGSPA
jgi:uncharacterized protein YjbJ (UPF0337 family)